MSNTMSTNYVRREFLTSMGKLALLVPAATVLSHCGNASSTDDGSNDGFTVTSSLANGHTHAIFVLLSDIASPPSTGLTFQSTTSSNHFHLVVLTQAQLTSVDEGAVVTVTSSVSDGHQHAFSIQKP